MKSSRLRSWVLALLALPAAPGAIAATEEVAVVDTPQGEIAWRFLPDAAPGHVAYVKQLIRSGFYDGTTLHRVIPHFVVQGGDPNSRNADRRDDGEGEADRRLKAEFSGLHYRPGTVGMARDVDPDSGSCQFFIALADLPRLDGRYTIFGEVISGLEVARRIADLPRDLNDNPLAPVPVRVRLEPREVPASVLSREPAAASGEVLTGPGKPRPFDAGNVQWTAPGPASPPAGLPAARVELSLDADGRVLDVRFPALDAPEPARLRSALLDWRFEPARYRGRAEKVRFEIDSDGKKLGPPTGGGAPVELGPGLRAPVAAVRLELAPGVAAPPRAPTLRLTVAADGTVTDAAVQSGSGDRAIDAAAEAAALKLVFAPATRSSADGDPEPVPVYLDVTTRFTESGPR
ncbi:MAG: peptidylprolyl isomerase [Acidobacteria bacterium]|nr:peptidylprolyl isomerase [Acidobacteriota bacterium]